MLLIFTGCFLVFSFKLTGAMELLSDEYIDEMNSGQASWQSGWNFDIYTPQDDIRRIANSVLPDNTLEGVREVFYDTNITIPESFDAREAWPHCSSIGQVYDQGSCGSAWAIAAVTTMTDRICIHSEGTVNTVVSVEDLLSCCTRCRFGCDGGYPKFAWEYWNTTGIATGGPYNSSEGCKSYSYEPCGHFNESTVDLCNTTVPAVEECRNECDSGSGLNYTEDLSFGSDFYTVYPDPDQIKLEIMKNGPVQATFNLFPDFFNYQGGVYVTDVSDLVWVGYHSAKIIGWGVKDDQPYWLIVNSWNIEWGENGLMKYLEGQNQMDMEVQVITGLPKLD